VKVRRATNDELTAIRKAAAKRKARDKEMRKEFQCPDEAKASVEGGIFWSLIEKWQDSPVYVIASAAALIWVIAMLVIKLVQSIAHLN
jgi:hypothetical protein